MAWTYNTADDVPSEGGYITTIAAAFTAASLLAVGLRFYVRVILVKSFGPDDWVLLATWVRQTFGPLDGRAPALIRRQFASLGFAVISIVRTFCPTRGKEATL